MSGQMCCISSSGTNKEKVLHLRLKSNKPWKPYTSCPQYAVPDYRIPGGSKGWASYQKLLQAGWTLIPTAKAQESLLAVS